MAKLTKAAPSAAGGISRARNSHPPRPIRVSLKLPSTAKGMREGIREVMKAASGMRCGRSERADVEIVLREALANAVFHGNGGDPSKTVYVRCTFSRSRGMVLSIRDQGGGFVPEEVPDPRESHRRFLHHGRGLFLMRTLVDRVEHRHGGREIVLYKEPSAEPAKKGVSRKR